MHQSLIICNLFIGPISSLFIQYIIHVGVCIPVLGTLSELCDFYVAWLFIKLLGNTLGNNEHRLEPVFTKGAPVYIMKRFTL